VKKAVGEFYTFRQVTDLAASFPDEKSAHDFSFKIFSLHSNDLTALLDCSKVGVFTSFSRSRETAHGPPRVKNEGPAGYEPARQRKSERERSNA